MASIAVQWESVVGAYGYRIYAGLVSTVYTEVSSDIAAPVQPEVTAGLDRSGSVTVPTEGSWYVAVAAYDVNGYQGPYGTEILKSTGSPTVGTITLSVR